MVKIAVVILNYNGKHYLEKFLPVVIEKSPEASIVVADNNSTDDSVELLSNHFPSVELIRLEKNLGYAGGYNEALKKVNSEYYLLLNSDIEVTDGWLTPLIRFLDENSAYASCQPKILDYETRTKFEYAGACGGYLDNLGYPYCRGRVFDYTEADDGQYDDPVDVFWSSGACMAVRAKDFHQVGAFDPSFFAHMEEVDLCWRLHSIGRKVKVIPKSVVFHVGGGTLSYQNPFKTYLNFRNGLKMLIKNLPSRQLVTKLPVRIFLDWVAFVLFLLKGNWKYSRSVARAHFHILKKFSVDFKKRSRTSDIPNRKSILWSYFIARKKTFPNQ